MKKIILFLLSLCLTLEVQAAPNGKFFLDYATYLYKKVNLSEEGLSFSPFYMALLGHYNLLGSEAIKKKAILSVIDFSKPSSTKRLFIFDLTKETLIYKTYVAHGKNSGEDLPISFSNIPESKTSSLGFFLTAEEYVGEHGLSIRLDGVEVGFNDNARERAIVMHGAEYVSEEFIGANNRLGRSWGCPAIPLTLIDSILPYISNGSTLFAYYPELNYFKNSLLLNPSKAEEILRKTGIIFPRGSSPETQDEFGSDSK